MHTMNDATMNEAMALAEERNESLEEKARKKFAKGPIPEMRPDIDAILAKVLLNVQAVREGRAPERIGGYSLDTLARILSSRTWLEYAGWSCEDALWDEKSSCSAEDVMAECLICAWTDEYGEWLKLVKALKSYLYEAAVFAKSVDSAAARFFLRARMALDGDSPSGLEPYSHVKPEDALKIVRLLRVAEARLVVDVALAALPKFKPVKARAVRKARKARKAKKD